MALLATSNGASREHLRSSSNVTRPLKYKVEERGEGMASLSCHLLGERLYVLTASELLLQIHPGWSIYLSWLLTD